jgi:hypothetical protein
VQKRRLFDKRSDMNRKTRRSSKTDEDLADTTTRTTPETENASRKVKVKGALKKKSFSKISNRLLSAGAIKSSNLTSSILITETKSTEDTEDTEEDKKAKKNRAKKAVSIVNADSAKAKYNPNVIESAQSSSNLYDNSNNIIVSPGRKHSTQSIKSKTLGKGWFDIAPAQLDIETKRDMAVVQMRDILDPKRYVFYSIRPSYSLATTCAICAVMSSLTQLLHSIRYLSHYYHRFYKRPDRGRTVIGTGTVIEGSTEYTTQRMNRKDRRTTITGEIMADKKIRDYTKRKHAEIQSAAAGTKKRPTKKPMGAREAWGSTKKNPNKKKKGI